MHLKCCEHPKRIRNPYLGKDVVVPCGHCNTCLQNKAMRYISAIRRERACWKYCLFVTLTYDTFNVPVLSRNDDVFFAKDIKHINPEQENIVINVDDLENTERDLKFISKQPYLLYLSPYDLSKFIKRYRSNLERFCVKNGYDKNKSAKVRYFGIGEYGETTYRPHYHVLFFFNTEVPSSEILKLVRESWKFGLVDASFVADDNASYVASYVNSLSNLPSIYRHKRIRPFILSSKCPAIGSLLCFGEEIQKIFYDGITEYAVYDRSKNAFVNVTLWQSLIDRLFPRITNYRNLSHLDRIRIYETVGNCYAESFSEFVEWCRFSRKSKFLQTYLESISDGFETGLNELRRLWLCCRRVVDQARVFNCSVYHYLNVMDEWFEKREKENLGKFFNFQVEFSAKYGSVNLVAADAIWFEDIINLDIYDFDYQELLILQGYGIDLDRFLSPDLDVRSQYRSMLLPENTVDSLCQMIDARKFAVDKMVTKRKNDYLCSMLSPEERERYIY